MSEGFIGYSIAAYELQYSSLTKTEELQHIHST